MIVHKTIESTTGYQSLNEVKAIIDEERSAGWTLELVVNDSLIDSHILAAIIRQAQIDGYTVGIATCLDDDGRPYMQFSFEPEEETGCRI